MLKECEIKIFSKEAIDKNLVRLINQIYKLLPMREEKLDWNSSLYAILEELFGMSEVLYSYQDSMLSICCKLKGLLIIDTLDELSEENKFERYRSTIFDCLNLMSKIRACLV